MTDLNKLRSEFEAQHSDKVFKIVKFDEATNAYCLHAHLPLTEINLSSLAEINYGWDLWQKAKAQAVPDTHIVVPKQPIPKMIDATWDFDEEIIEMSSNTRNEFIWKKMVEASESGAEQ
ncbi:hypothetical protein QM274_02815 [Acinetobacter baumannii]|uniref:hypothetical protein n=1 Tax=Acinetobacter baumannii TaxID=470 RepID=UPI0024B73EE9|nr:hypothetical protein [Acinetobacter baumannii]MDI9751173.1 hypothetical protein [Acinetobacter baumannii]